MDIVKWAIILSISCLAVLILSYVLYGFARMPNSVASGARIGQACSDTNSDAAECIWAKEQAERAFGIRSFLANTTIIMGAITIIAVFISNLLASREILAANVAPGTNPAWLIPLWLLPAIGGLAYLVMGRRRKAAPKEATV